MKTNLFKTLATVAFSLSLMVLVGGQSASNVQAQTPSPSPTPTPILDNTNRRLQRIELLYSSQPDQAGPFIAAVGNYYIPNDTKQLKFNLELSDRNINELKVRLELRQVCRVRYTRDIDKTQEQEIFTLNERNGVVLRKNQGETMFQLIIKVHEPVINPPHPGVHCFENPDHLGEGPYSAIIEPSEPNLNSDAPNQRLHVVYTQEFETVGNTKMTRLKALDALKQKQPVRPRPRRRQQPLSNAGRS